MYRRTRRPISGIYPRPQHGKYASGQVLHFINTTLTHRYSENQQFRIHWDWLQPDDTDQTLAKSGNRVSSFFVYLVANCTGGTTRFSEVPRPLAPEWCGALKCRDEDGNETSSLEVNAAVGRAVFWYNLDPTGVPDRKTLHAGMPVLEGTKVGLNIWTRERSFRN